VIEHLTTARLILRRPTLADLDAVHAYASDPAVTKYMGWPRHETPQTTRAFILMRHEEWEKRGTGTFLVEKDGAVIGSTGLHTYDDAPAATGYIIARPHWGHGYATEATRAMLELARSRGYPRVEAGCHPENLASIRVLEKCGLRHETTKRAHMMFPNLSSTLSDLMVFAINL
jgi:[ribosomal protein S5]-alanine N-acetyltransferase